MRIVIVDCNAALVDLIYVSMRRASNVQVEVGISSSLRRPNCFTSPSKVRSDV